MQHSITEHIYAARRQHFWTGERLDKPISLDWIDAVWLLICAISITSPLVERGTSRMLCNACISSSTSMKSSVSKWDRIWNPGGSRKKVGENGSLVHWSSAKVVWSTIRREPAKIEEFRSCLLANVSLSHTWTFHQRLPKYSPFDSAREINALRSTGIKQLLHCPHVKLNLRRHPKASLHNQISA